MRPWRGRWSWAGYCTLGPIDTTLAGLAALAGDDDRAETLAASALASAETMVAPGFAAEAEARLRDVRVGRAEIRTRAAR